MTGMTPRRQLAAINAQVALLDMDAAMIRHHHPGELHGPDPVCEACGKRAARYRIVDRSDASGVGVRCGECATACAATFEAIR